MEELSRDADGKVLPSFEDIIGGRAGVFAVIAVDIPGRILVDCTEQPNTAFIDERRRSVKHTTVRYDMIIDEGNGARRQP